MHIDLYIYIHLYRIYIAMWYLSIDRPTFLYAFCISPYLGIFRNGGAQNVLWRKNPIKADD